MAGPTQYSKPGTSVAHLELALEGRLSDAELLYNASHVTSAIVSFVYAVEIQLKILICRHLDLEKLPRAFEIHDLQELIVLTGLSRRVSLKGEDESPIVESWSLLTKISNDITNMRYGPPDDQEMATATDVRSYVIHDQKGIIPWLLRQTQT